MMSRVIGQISVTVRGVTREFEAIKIVNSGGDLGLPEKGFAFRQHAPGYASNYLAVIDEATATMAIRVLAADFAAVMMSAEIDDD